MRSCLGMLGIYLVIKAVLLGVGLGIGALLHWIIPSIDLGIGTLIGVMVTIAAIFAINEILHIHMPSADLLDEFRIKDPPIVFISPMDEEFSPPRKRRRK